ncbi:MAG TPA: DUF924 family protein [Burkholderiales bacterium]
MQSLASGVLHFWFGEGAEHGKSHQRWFVKNDAFDAEIRSRFERLHDTLSSNRDWLDDAPACLARIIVLDQFPRNMFRGTARAFASDALALEAASVAVERAWDRGMLPVEQLFVYLPFEHSENLADQDRACELMKDFDAGQRDYAERHRGIIRRFGRFPHRNALLGRASSPEEIEFLKTPGSGF